MTCTYMSYSQSIESQDCKYIIPSHICMYSNDMYILVVKQDYNYYTVCILKYGLESTLFSRH